MFTSVRLSPRSIVGLLVAALLVSAACGAESDDVVRGDPDNGSGGLPRNSESAVLGEWELTSGTSGTAAFPLVDGRPITIGFLEDGTASGTAACNQFSGAYDLDGTALRFREIAMTDMGCEPAVHESESAFLEALEPLLTVARDSDSLTLTAEGVSLHFVAVVPIPTAELVGTAWNLHSLFTGDSASNTGGDATLILNPDGSFSAGTGCRTITGTYRLDGERITLAESSSDGTCGPDETRQDGHVTSVLRAPRAEIEGDQLRLWNSDGEGLGYQAAMP